MGRTSTSPAGDIVFVRPDPRDWAGAVVARLTGGPYAHVQIRLNHYEVVEALSRGVVRDALAAEPDAADVAAVGGGLESARLAHALTWLLAQVGAEYSGWDIAADALKALLPRTLGARTPFLVAPRTFDCSQLAAEFLMQAGYEWLPDAITLDPARVSPNDLARALGVLKP
jgi:hypothetical protein